MLKPLTKGSKPNILAEQRTPVLWVTVIASVLFIATALFMYVFDGVPELLPQLLYIPILVAAAVTGLPGSLVVGLLMALIGGTLMGAGPGEEMLGSWALGSLYVLFGLIVGPLFQMSRTRFTRVEGRVNKLSTLYSRTLSSLAKTVEVRDRHTQGHCERVAENAIVLGKALGLSEVKRDLLYWSALLHDMGKIVVPEYILLKDGELSAHEYAEVKRHPDYAADLLLSVSPEFSEIASVVRAHHERYDGTGYPLSLRGAQIPELSRIISVVDVFEALTSRRPYRQPMPPTRALRYLIDNAGSQFDPLMVDTFARCFAKGELIFSSEMSTTPAPVFTSVPVQQAYYSSVSA